MRRLPVLVIAGVAALTACASTHYVTVAGKQQKCVDATTQRVVSSSHCSNGDTDDTWYWLMLMNNGSTYSVTQSLYNSTPVGKQLNTDDEDLDDEVDENGDTISQAPPDEDQDGANGDNNDGGGSDDGDDGGDGGGDDD